MEKRRKSWRFNLLSVRLCLIVMSFAISTLLQAQTNDLYLLSATSSAKTPGRFGSILYRLVSKTSNLENLLEIVSPQAGIDFVVSDYSLRIIVLGFPPNRPFAAALLKMDEPKQTFALSLPFVSGFPAVAYYLLHQPGSGPALGLSVPARAFANVRMQGSETVKLLEKPLFGSSANEVIGSWGDLEYAFCDGHWGTAIGGGQFIEVQIDSDGMLHKPGTNSNFGIPAPKSLALNTISRKALMAIWIKNNEIGVLANANEFGTCYIYDNNTGDWWREKLTSEHLLYRGFKHWFVGMVAPIKKDESLDSPGKNVREKSVLVGTDGTGKEFSIKVEDLFSQDPHYFPGKFFVCNAKTKKIYNISTEQGDSEIVLANDKEIYYRVNDQLFRVSVGQESLGDPQLIIQDKRITQVHWVFDKRTVNK